MTVGVAGLIQPNSKVDVLFTRPGSMAEATTSTILQNVKVLSTGRQTQTGQAVGQPFSGHTNSVLSVAYSPDGKYITSGSYDKTVRIWDIAFDSRDLAPG